MKTIVAVLALLACASAQTQFAHLLIVVQENRTPDNLFGSCVIPGADVIPVGGPVALGTTADIPHNHTSFLSEFNGDWPPLSKNYVQNSDVQPYCALAQSYGFANRMFQTNQGPSGPAHQFLFGGTSAPVPVGQPNDDLMAADNGGSCVNATPQDFIDPLGGMHWGSGCEEHGTLTDLLEAAGLSWAYYTPSAGNLWTAPNMIQHICQPSSGHCAGSDFRSHVILPSTLNPRTILSDIASNNLAQVSWVIPSGQNSDHPAYGSGGPAWVSAIVNACGQNQDCWNSTAIIVVWDDWGGFYDHVAPPVGWYPAYTYGFRVPLLAISSRTPANYVSNVQMDFGSILKFVEQNFNLPLIGNGTYADAYAQFDMGFFGGPVRKFAQIRARKLTKAELESKSDPDDE